jgi:hypothetical protein
METDDLHIARQAAKLFVSQMASIPSGTQLMTLELLVKAIFLHDVIPAKRLELFDRWSGSMRKEIRSSCKTQSSPKKRKKTDGK